MRRDMANRQVKPRVSAEDNVLSETNTSQNLFSDLQNDDEVTIEYIKKSERLRGYDMDQLDFCHHCMQLKQTQIHVRCRYQSTKHRVAYPNSIYVNGIKVYNANMSQPNLVNTLILKRLVTDTKRRQSLEENLEITCGRKYCSFCLKNFYDTSFNTAKNDPNWCCPHCTK